MLPISTIDESNLWRHLDGYAEHYKESFGREYPKENKTALDTLKGSVRKVADQAEYIGDLIIRHMPQYTLHNEQHYLNVLGIMDALIPKEVLKGMTPLECALCIMTAFTHDLGMALSIEEYQKLTDASQDTPEGRRFLTYRNSFGEECRQLERWRAKRRDAEDIGDHAAARNAEHRISYIEGHILSGFLRETHTREDASVLTSRIERWLDNIAIEAKNEGLYTYNGYDFKHDLALIGLSHGKPVTWLRETLCRERGGEDDDFIQLGMDKK